MSPETFTDASGATLSLPAPPRRIVSLVPSVTETLFALGLGQALVGCTTYCVEPREGVADKARVGGTKDPRLEAIRALAPDLVLANMEENERADVEALRAQGLRVFVNYPRTVAEGVRMIRELGALTGTEARAAALAAPLEARLATLRARPAGRPAARVFCPIWRRPWMTINRDTYVHDMLAVCGGENVFADREPRYPEVTLAEVAAARPEVILLPDEPYRFRRAHLADFTPYRDVPAVRDGRLHLMDGRLLAWYGPRIGQALETLPPLLG